VEPHRLDALAEIAHAETLVIRALESGPKSVDDVRRSLRLGHGTVCRVLTRLRTAGVVIATKRPERRGCLYRLATVRTAPRTAPDARSASPRSPGSHQRRKVARDSTGRSDRHSDARSLIPSPSPPFRYPLRCRVTGA
jgi:DNA-binding transcriptional ArsR family regulator